MATSSSVITAKRGITGGLGLFGLGALLAPWAEVRDHPSALTWGVLAIHIVGPLLAIAILSRLPGWRGFRPDLRVGLIFLGSFLIPGLALWVLGQGELTGHLIISLIVALSAGALWWVLLGQQLDASDQGDGLRLG